MGDGATVAAVSAIDYSGARVPVREDVAEAHRGAWKRMARPGTWFTGAERVAIAAESRAAWDCRLCAERKAALSPNAVGGKHDRAGDALPDALVEVIHRVTTDPGRLSRGFVEQALAGGLTDAQYVEAVGVVVRTVSVDFFCRAMGLPPNPLPEPQPGELTRRRPEGAREDGAFVPMIPYGKTGPDADIYPGNPPNVLRALSLVPDEVRGITDLSRAHYLSPRDLVNPGSNGGRAISRPQIELIAGRVSALNECFY